MKGDFSRLTFDKKKHYSGVLMQQGRVQLDADWNEQQEIVQYRTESETADTIGSSGVPKVGGGFAIGVTTDGNDLTVSSGHIYVEGILCENDRKNITLLAQDDYPLENSGKNLVGFKMPVEKGRHLAYLDVWKRSVTCIEDPDIREKALGGPDTTTRSKIVWQIKLAKVTDDVLCFNLTKAWRPKASTGKVTAHLSPAPSGGSPCQPTSDEGYLGLENHLYRIEIHQGGNRNEATFKWSRNNGSEVASVSEMSGQEVILDGAAKGDIEKVSNGGWVELIDDRRELIEQRGVLVKIKSFDHSNNKLVFDSDASIPILDGTKHRKLRWWDHRTINATSDGIPIPTGRIQIEDGIEIEFSDGIYNSGDYWLIPARAALIGQEGDIDWPKDGENQLAHSPKGIEHHYCPLALVDFDPNRKKFSSVAGGDCRKLFPPLTAITASDVSFDNSSCALPTEASTVQEALDALCSRGGQCTVLFGPNDRWLDMLEQIAQYTNVQVCFQAGEYRLDKPFFIKGGKGRHIRVTGCGMTTRIRATQAEAVMVFQDWESVSFENISVEAGITTHAMKVEPPLNGTLTFHNCSSVSVEKVSAACRSGIRRQVACISVFNGGPTTDVQTENSVRICNCKLRPGGQQIGILVTNAGRTHVEGNIIERNDQAGLLTTNDMFNDRHYRHAFSRRLMKNMQINPTFPAPENMAKIHYKGYTITLVTTEDLVPAWQKLVDDEKPEGINSPRALSDYFKKRVDKIVSDKGIVPGIEVFAKRYESVSKKYFEIGRMRMNDEIKRKIKKELVSSVRVGARELPVKNRTETLMYNNLSLYFETEPVLVGSWQNMFKDLDFEKIEKPQKLVKKLRKIVDNSIRNLKILEVLPQIRPVVASLSKVQSEVAIQGIVLAGSCLTDVRIINNSISDTQQGIHVGLSHKGAPRTDHDIAKRIMISGNTIVVRPVFAPILQPHGIFVGNCRSLIIENNYVEIKPDNETVLKGQSVDGVRIFGILGPMIIIRQNHIENASIGIYVNALEGSASGANQWLAGDNIAKGAKKAIVSPDAMRNNYTHA